MRKAYTLIEIAMVMAVVAIVCAVSLPTTNTKVNQEADLAGQNFQTDVSFARSYSIAHPEDPAVIKIDLTNNRYWLAKQSAPDTPLTHPQTKGNYLIQYGTGGAKGFEHVQIAAFDFGGDNVVKIDSTGMLDQSTPAVLQLQSASSRYEVDVSSESAQSTMQNSFVTDLGAIN